MNPLQREAARPFFRAMDLSNLLRIAEEPCRPCPEEQARVARLLSLDRSRSAPFSGALPVGSFHAAAAGCLSAGKDEPGSRPVKATFTFAF